MAFAFKCFLGCILSTTPSLQSSLSVAMATVQPSCWFLQPSVSSVKLIAKSRCCQNVLEHRELVISAAPGHSSVDPCNLWAHCRWSLHAKQSLRELTCSYLTSIQVQFTFFFLLAGNGTMDCFLKMPILCKYFTFYKLFIPLPLVFLRQWLIFRADYSRKIFTLFRSMHRLQNSYYCCLWRPQTLFWC